MLAFTHPNTSMPSPRDTTEDVTAYFTYASQPRAPPPRATYDPQDMGKAEKGHPAVEILVNSDVLVLRGTGVDVAPALLSGNVVLYLSEPTSIKEITLSFRGKARIPLTQTESLTLNTTPLTYIVCHHEWSFLEGNKSHSHTLKAGRHLFPFQLQIGGSLPSSISTSALGGASVSYKLRASVVRPGFSLSLSHKEVNAIHPIHILRGFTPEALEYQQTLEIENTWPEKLMYSIMIPHKAWPAGDRVTAVVKFQPLVKGARVQSVTTTINELVKLHGRTGIQENSRVIATAKHEMVDGQAVCVDEHTHRFRIPLLHHHAHSRSVGSTPPSTSTPSTSHAAHFTLDSPGDMTPLTTVTTNSSSSSGSGPRERHSSDNVSAPRTDAVAGPSTHQQSPMGTILPDELVEEPSSDVVTTLQIAIPDLATPAHTLEPIQVSHRIRWSIMIANSDGHVSELRCSLPLHIIDNRLYDEAHNATMATRRLLLGSRDVDGGQAVGTHGAESDDEEDVELPTYPDHVRDRVANSFLPETALMRMANPWVLQGVSPIIYRGATSSRSPGMVTPAQIEPIPYFRNTPQAHDPLAQLPAVPSSDTEQLHWVNSELLMSLGDQSHGHSERSRHSPTSHTPPGEPESTVQSSAPSRSGSRFPSRRGSRSNSRAASPERQSSDGSRVSLPMPALPSSQDKTYVHSHSAASRNTHGLFNISMKPFTSLSSQFHLPHRGVMSSHSSIHGSSHLSNMTPARQPSSPDLSRGPSRPPSRNSTPSSSGLNTPALPRSATEDQIALHRAFIETPDYEIASRGFLGGGIPPLSSFVGLPSYEEASAGLERSMSDTDLAGRMGAAMRLSSTRTRPHQGHRGRDDTIVGTSTAPPSPPRRAAAQAQP